ncbi:LOB domain-containing protein 6-like [Zingiber officinale]|uniref:LOB domain-containing protein 6-like n=1 Tax=Zingiber officinale TaxID=94328 RepID=UPI001C4B59D3|nr:LOB domain-containing protein 6-like [Zingiber officinale]
MASSSSSPAQVALSSSVPTASVSSPCAACKFLRRKCQPECVFAPYFPPDQPQKFVHVHRVFGASNVTKLLNELHPYQREDAVNSLAYEADMRLRDPVYGCVKVITTLQHQLRQLQIDLSCAKFELSKYQSAAALAQPPTLPSAAFLNHHNHVTGFGFWPDPLARDVRHCVSQHQWTLRTPNGDSDLTARDAGLAAAMNATTAATIGLFGTQYSKHSAAGGHERSGVGPIYRSMLPD